MIGNQSFFSFTWGFNQGRFGICAWKLSLQEDFGAWECVIVFKITYISPVKIPKKKKRKSWFKKKKNCFRWQLEEYADIVLTLMHQTNATSIIVENFSPIASFVFSTKFRQNIFFKPLKKDHYRPEMTIKKWTSGTNFR